MTQNKTTKKLAVFGNPIAQSKSPTIHNMFAEQFDIAISYERILGEEGNFHHQLDQFFADPNALGANVTMPFKEQAANWATKVSSAVAKADAANTIIRHEGGFKAETTDGKGLVSDLLRNDILLKGQTLLLIGAGGAARGAIEALLNEQVEEILISNRSEENARRLVAIANDERVKSIAEFDCHELNVDVIINATSLSLSGKLPAVPDLIFANRPAVYDMVYQDSDTCFITKAKSHSCDKAVDGLGMLVGQAAESFYLWFGLRPDVEPVLNYLRDELRSTSKN